MTVPGIEARDLPYAARSARLTGSIIDSSTSLLQRQSHDIVRFAMGSPAAEAIPAGTLGEICSRIISPTAIDALDYGATEGNHGLRIALAAFLAEQGQPVELDRLLITAGGMQGIDLVCKLFLDAGDLVAVEAPTYTNGVATIASYEGTLIEVPVDHDGMVVDALADHVATTGVAPKLIYTIPTFQNPSGATLSRARRLRLLELAASWGAIVLEDDPYSLLRFDGEHVPSLQSLSGDAPWVIGVHTFSKILAAGLRVGWVIADPEIVERMVAAKQCMDTCTNVPAQRLAETFLVEGHMDAHLAELRVIYLERKRAMQAALTDAFGHTGTRWTDPDGGFFLWLTFPATVDTEALFPRALAEGVAYIPGPAFSVERRFVNALRLCFASAAPARTLEGVARLRHALVATYGDAWS